MKPDYFLATESVEAVKDNDGWSGMVMEHKPDPGDSVAWWANQIYTDPSGTIKYLAVYADHRSPKVTAKLTGLPPTSRIFDVMTGGEVKGRTAVARVTLRPGEAFFYAVTPAAPENLQLTAPQRITAGDPLTLHVESTKGQAGVYGIVIDVYKPSGERSAVHSLSNVNLIDGIADVRIPTAYNDPPGEFRVVATESLTRRTSEGVPRWSRRRTRAARRRSRHTRRARAMIGRRSQWIRRSSSPSCACRLRDYDGDWEGPEAKYMLSYYLHVAFRPANRHWILRTLQRTDWTPHPGASPTPSAPASGSIS